jgi:hypothetical protein
VYEQGARNPSWFLRWPYDGLGLRRLRRRSSSKAGLAAFRLAPIQYQQDGSNKNDQDNATKRRSQHPGADTTLKRRLRGLSRSGSIHPGAAFWTKTLPRAYGSSATPTRTLSRWDFACVR